MLDHHHILPTRDAPNHSVKDTVFSGWIKFPMETLRHLRIFPPLVPETYTVVGPPHQKYLHQLRNLSRRVWTLPPPIMDQEHTAELTKTSSRKIVIWTSTVG